MRGRDPRDPTAVAVLLMPRAWSAPPPYPPPDQPDIQRCMVQERLAGVGGKWGDEADDLHMWLKLTL